MTELTALWMPIVGSAVLVFLASSLIHMVLPWHKSDYPKLPNEDAVLDALRPFNLPPGDYLAPRAAHSSDMKNPEFQAKLEKGPLLVLTVMPKGSWNMGQSLSLWFVYLLVIGVFAAYVSGRALAPGAHYLSVFRFSGVTAFCCYALGLYQMSIWYKRGWGLTLKATFDGLLYALLTAGVFGWLWPR